MYSGTTLHNKSGNLLGAHQKFDRSARRLLEDIRPDSIFPDEKQILHFEGNNGPDGVKRKSAGKDEPWHFWDPTNSNDTFLLETVGTHYKSLIKQLKNSEDEKAAFEAAWLAHAIVDGLTPPHHYPYEAKMVELRGEGMETRNSVKSKILIKGQTRRQTVQKNWKTWGAKGLIISHGYFEFGVSSAVKTMNFKKYTPTKGDIQHVKNIGFNNYLKELALEIYELDMFERFLKRGWTMKLGREIRTELAPRMVQAITLAWLLALDEGS